MNSNWRADPLVRGHRPTVFEVFLEPTCPFSVKAFGQLDALLDRVGEDRLTVKLRRETDCVIEVHAAPDPHQRTASFEKPYSEMLSPRHRLSSSSASTIRATDVLLLCPTNRRPP